MAIVYVVIGLAILYGVYYFGYRKGESDTHSRRNGISQWREQRLTKRTPDGGCTCAKVETYIIKADGVAVCASCFRPRR